MAEARSGRRERIEQKLRDRLGAAHVEVVDESHRHVGHAGAASGGGHFRATIVSEKFAGLSRVAAQRLVYETLADEMGGEIHALAMKTLTPEEWRDGKPPKGGERSSAD
ncbi:MAG: BolA family transcriptional regulator [Proteobacteria bacterium]|nr:BolA family transcriptional regulator [Pseudomonadota bacterium]MCZ6784422.1 BolA family transcriptional regulator [Pseudomonadota bacterium]